LSLPVPIKPGPEFPGPQKTIRRLKPSFTLALTWGALPFLTFLMCLQLGASLNVLTPKWSALGARVDARIVATMLMGALSLVYVRRQFALGMRPIIDYRSWQSADSEFGLIDKGDGQKVFVVQIVNVGSGPLIVTSTAYRALFGNDSMPDYSGFGDVRRVLIQRGLQFGREVLVINLGEGTALESRGERIVFEMLLSAAASSQIRRFDVCIEFEGLLGDLYRKEMFYVPTRGIDSLFKGDADGGRSAQAPEPPESG